MSQGVALKAWATGPINLGSSPSVPYQLMPLEKQSKIPMPQFSQCKMRIREMFTSSIC